MKSEVVIESAAWPHDWCPVEHAITLLDGRWTVLILRELFRDGPCRFLELQRRLGNLSPRTLTDRLKRLEKDGLIQRVPLLEKEASGYALTERGESLGSILKAMIAWSECDLERRV